MAFDFAHLVLHKRMRNYCQDILTFMDAFLRVYDLIPVTVHCEENSVKMKMQYNNKVPSASIF